MGYRQRESVTSPSEQVIEEALSYINVNYMNPLTLDELAETHGMNSKQFSYFFISTQDYDPLIMSSIIVWRGQGIC